jgi:Fe-S-cluster containining protein
MPILFYEQGLRFECQRCSSCCRFEPGIVRVHNRDEAALLDFLHLGKRDFEERYCRPGVAQDGGPELWLKEKSNFDCIFWEDGRCIVYPARPRQCTTWPFWASNLASQSAWYEAALGCPGMGKGRLWTRGEIEKLASKTPP